VTPRMIGMSMALAALAWTPSAQAPVPLDLVGVRIDEGRLARNEIGADRDVTFVFLLERAPVCDRANDALTYAVLMDADLDSATGARLRPLPGLGIERQAAVRCDGDAGRFVSRSGAVVTEGPMAVTPRHTIKLTMRLTGLPAHEFNWVGVVRNGLRFGRVPQSGEPVYWAITERALW
jgi:hypothetical protein